MFEVDKVKTFPYPASWQNCRTCRHSEALACIGPRLPLLSLPLYKREGDKDVFSGHVRPRQGTKLCNFRMPSPLFLVNFSTGFFPFSPGFLRNLVTGSPPKCGEDCLISRRRKKRRILSRLWLSWFSGCHGFLVPIFGSDSNARKPLRIKMQLQVFSWCHLKMIYCSVVPFCTGIYSGGRLQALTKG